MTSTKTTMFGEAGYVPHQKYRADIDSLRTIAILTVVGFHAFPNLFRGGFIGLEAYFMIFGFIILGYESVMSNALAEVQSGT